VPAAAPPSRSPRGAPAALAAHRRMQLSSPAAVIGYSCWGDGRHLKRDCGLQQGQGRRKQPSLPQRHGKVSFPHGCSSSVNFFCCRAKPRVALGSFSVRHLCKGVRVYVCMYVCMCVCVGGCLWCAAEGATGAAALPPGLPSCAQWELTRPLG